MKKICLAVISLTLLSLNTCDENPVNGDNIKPGRRDYIWIMDTLNTYANRIQSIWGSSPDNVWACGPGGLSNTERLWHFDGIRWEKYQQGLSLSPECIYGFAENNIWIGGNDGKIFQFNGSSWNQRFMITRQDTVGNWVNDIWGNKPNDIYALGRAYVDQEPLPRSFILHYNGTIWKEVYFSSKQEQYFRIRKVNDQSYLFALILTQTVEPDTLIFYKSKSNNLSEIYRNSLDKIVFGNLSQLGNDIYFLIGQDLKQYVNGNFQIVISFNESMFGYQASGRNKKDIFLRMKDGIAHYNGDNVEYLYHFSNNYTSTLNEPIIMENDVFYAVHDNQNDLNLILRGKLIE